MMHEERGIGRFSDVRQFSDHAAALGGPPSKAAEAGVEGEAVLLEDMDKIQADLFGIGVRRRSQRRHK